MPLDLDLLRAITRQANGLASAAGALIGPPIESGKVRKIYGLIISNPDVGPVTIGIFRGDVTTPIAPPAEPLSGPLVIPTGLPPFTLFGGADLKTPIFTVRPTEDPDGDPDLVTLNEVRVAQVGGVSFANILYLYYDEDA
jgi:hypothetical protein